MCKTSLTPTVLGVLLALAMAEGRAVADYFYDYTVTTDGYNVFADGSRAANGISIADHFELQPVTPFLPGGSPSADLALITESGAAKGIARISLATWYGELDGTGSGLLAQPASYTLNLTLTDGASGQSGTLKFAGQLQRGELGYGGFGDIPNSYLGATARSLTLGGNRYTVTLEPPPFIGTANVVYSGVSTTDTLYFPDNAIAYADVAVVATAPEPSCLALAGLGLATLLGGCLFSRRAEA